MPTLLGPIHAAPVGGSDVKVLSQEHPPRALGARPDMSPKWRRRRQAATATRLLQLTLLRFCLGAHAGWATQIIQTDRRDVCIIYTGQEKRSPPESSSN